MISSNVPIQEIAVTALIVVVIFSAIVGIVISIVNLFKGFSGWVSQKQYSEDKKIIFSKFDDIKDLINTKDDKLRNDFSYKLHSHQEYCPNIRIVNSNIDSLSKSTDAINDKLDIVIKHLLNKDQL
jgi:hypothetical protein